MLKKDDAERLIVQAWRGWCRAHVPLEREPNGNDALLFYAYLQRDQSHLLSFRCLGDKWQVINGWIMKNKYSR